MKNIKKLTKTIADKYIGQSLSHKSLDEDF